MQSAVRAGVRDHCFGEISAIESVAVRRGDLFQRRRDGGTRKPLADLRGTTVGQKMFGESEVVRQNVRGERPFFGDDGGHREAVARIADRRHEQVAEGQGAIALRQRRPARNRAGNRDCFPAPFRYPLHPGITCGIRRRGSAARCIESDKLAPVPDDREQIAAETVAARLDDRERDGRCERRIDGVAAALKHRDARLDVATTLRAKTGWRRDG